MINRLKHMLGIEGAKVKIFLEEGSLASSGKVSGQVELVSMTPVIINSLYIKVEERYQRGRGTRKLIDKYLLAEDQLPVRLELLANQPVLFPFSIEYDPLTSPIDEFSQQNPLNGLIAWAARKAKNVSSSYMVTVEALVEGARLPPFDTVVIPQ